MTSKIYNFLKKTGCNAKGFSLVEIIVVFALFIVILQSAIGIYVSAIKKQQYILSSQQILDQMSYSGEYISRFARMAIKDSLSQCVGSDDCVVSSGGANYCTNSSGNILTFLDYKEECMTFSLQNGQIYQHLKDINGNPIGLLDNIPLTSSNLIVNNFKVVILGNDALDNLQPRVTMYFEMSPIGGEARTSIKFQTTISQRNLDK